MDTVKCPNCRTVQQTGAPVCFRCGAALATGGAAPTSPPARVDVEGDPPAPPPMLTVPRAPRGWAKPERNRRQRSPLGLLLGVFAVVLVVLVGIVALHVVRRIRVEATPPTPLPSGEGPSMPSSIFALHRFEGECPPPEIIATTRGQMVRVCAQYNGGGLTETLPALQVVLLRGIDGTTTWTASELIGGASRGFGRIRWLGGNYDIPSNTLRTATSGDTQYACAEISDSGGSFEGSRGVVCAWSIGGDAPRELGVFDWLPASDPPTVDQALGYAAAARKLIG